MLEIDPAAGDEPDHDETECAAGRHRPDDDPAPGDRCKDCGHELTWIGPGPEDWATIDDDR